MAGTETVDYLDDEIIGGDLIEGLPRSEFFPLMARQGTALTFDDMLIDTGWSDVDHREADIKTKFSENVELKDPFVSAAMDTVTRAPMAEAMSRMGGVGVIGAYLDPETQRKEVRKVKRALSGKIEDPICVRPEQTLESVLRDCDEKGYTFRSFPVVDSEGKFTGVITQKNFTFHQSSPSTLVTEAMTPAKKVITGSPKTKYKQAYRQMVEHDKLTLPLLNKDKTVAGLYVWTDVNQAVNGDRSPYNVDDLGRLRVGMAVATDKEAVERVMACLKYIDFVVIDNSKGDHRHSRKTLEEIVEAVMGEAGGVDVIPGNITNGKSAVRLARMGANGIKVGQGGGAICSTRPTLGYGCPQATAVYRVSEALRLNGFDHIPVCSDGGISELGHVPMALASGADTVMMGKMLAGTDQSPGPILEIEGKRYKRYRGMGSLSAMLESDAARKRYNSDNGPLLPEGVDSMVEYQGSVYDVLASLELALRKSMSGYDAANIAQLKANCRFQRTTPAGLRESNPHDVRIVAFPSTQIMASAR